MREIKFRSWDTVDKCMIEVNQIHFTDNRSKVVTSDDCWDWYKRDRILMQYTGLKDRNGKEIWEGDIVKQTYHTERRGEEGDHEWLSFDGHHLGQVVITVRGVCLKNPLHYSMETDETNPMNAYKQIAGYRSEVIGNIYENADLLRDSATESTESA